MARSLPMSRAVLLLCVIVTAGLNTACIDEIIGIWSRRIYVETTIKEHDDYWGNSDHVDPNRSFYGSVVSSGYGGIPYISASTDGNGEYTASDVQAPATWDFWENNGPCANEQVADDMRVSNKAVAGLVCDVYTGYNHSTYIKIGTHAFSLQGGDPVTSLTDIGRSYLSANDHMYPGDMMFSPNGDYSLVFQSDGNMVLFYQGVEAIWKSDTIGTGSDAIMQSDGNFVIYDGGSSPVFYTGTQGNSGAYLNLQDDSNLVVYTSGNSPLWSAW